MSGIDLVVLPSGQQYKRSDVPEGYDAAELPTLAEHLASNRSPQPAPKGKAKGDK